MSVTQDSFISVLDVAPEANAADGPRVKAVYRKVVADCLSAEDVDAHWDRIDETMTSELRRTGEQLRSQWRASWRYGDQAARLDAQRRVAELAERRRSQRDLYEEAMSHVGLLRGKHIELLEWAMKSNRQGWRLTDQPDSEETLCKSFVIVLDDGEEVIPYRKRPRGQSYSAFFVSNSGNKRQDAIDVFTESELRRLVIGLGYRVYCRNREGTRAGLYTARSPNHVRSLKIS